MRRYTKFLKLKSKYPERLLVPTFDIELIWLSHLIRPLRYQEDCEKLCGKVIPHAILSNQCEELLKYQGIQTTATLWETEYKEPYLCFPLEKPTKKLLFSNRQRKYTWCVDSFRDESKESKQTLYQFLTKNVAKWKPADWLSLTVEEAHKDRSWFGLYGKYMETNSGPRGRTAPTDLMTKTYERFLFYLSKYRDESNAIIQPPAAIDIVWHGHMISPVEYAKDTQDLFDRELLNHEPWPELSLSQENQSTCLMKKKIGK